MTRYLFISLLILTAFNCNSQTTDSIKNYDLEEIIITASRSKKFLQRSPEVMHVITSRNIEQLNVSSTGEILEYLTGVNVESGTGSGFPKRSIVSLDGFPANYSLVMVDGIRLLTEHIHTGQNIDLIPPESIERIEVIKGAASAQYGSDAMGGIINIITKKSGKETESSISFSGGSYETYKTSVSVRTPVSNNVGIATITDYEQSDGITVLAPKHRIGNMGYSEFSTMNNINWAINKTSSLSSSVFYKQNSMEFRDDDVYGKMLLSSVDYNHYIGKNIQVTGRLKYSHWNAEQSGENNSIINPEFYINYDKFENNIITAGGDFRHNKFARSSVLEKTQDAFGIFLQDEYENDKFSFLFALRFDKVENIKPVIAPKIAGMYRIHDKFRVRASLGRGFHAPTVQELYEEGYGHGGRAYRFGNPDLEPEYSMTSTFSVEYDPVKNVHLLIHGYYNTISNMITPVYSGIWKENPDTSSVIDKWVRTNIHEAEIYGVEATLRYQLYDKFLAEGGYNYSENRNKSTGGQLPYYPGESFFSKIVYKYKLFAGINSSCFVSLRATKNRSAWNWKPAAGTDFDNAEGLVTKLNDYQLLNAGMKFHFRDKFNIYLNVGNLLGQDIQKLDDLLTEIDGEPVWKIGCLINL